MSTINQGVLAHLIIISFIILLLTDWLDFLVKRLGIKKKLLYFLLIAYLSMFFDFTILNWTINVGGFIIPLLGYLFLFITIKGDKVYVVTATMLLGATYFLMRELIRLDPVLLIVKDVYEISLIMVVITLLVSPTLKHKLTLVLGGVLLGEVIFNYQHMNSFLTVTLGSGKLRDLIWLAILQIIAFEYMILMLKNIIYRFKNLRQLELERTNND